MTIMYVFVLILVVVVNILMPIFIRTYILRMFKKQNETNIVLHRLGILHQYVQSLIIIISMFVFMFAASMIMVRNEINRIILTLMPFLFLLVVVIINQILYRKVFRIIRKIETTAKEDIIEVTKSFLLLMLPSIVVIVFNREILIKLGLNEFIRMAVVILLIVVINVLYPFVVKLFYNAISIKSKHLGDTLTFNMAEHGYKNVRIYEWSTTKSKVANAIVCGIFVKKIFVSDYLIKNLTVEEIKAILAHEVGHLKGFHLWIRTALIIIAYPIFIPIGYAMESFEEATKINIPIPLGVVLFLLIFILYFVFLGMLFSRMQERQADEYVIKSGIAPEVFISALTKLTVLNDSLETMGKFEEKLESHPSLSNRIKYINKFTESMNMARKQSSKQA